MLAVVEGNVNQHEYCIIRVYRSDGFISIASLIKVSKLSTAGTMRSSFRNSFQARRQVLSVPIRTLVKIRSLNAYPFLSHLRSQEQYAIAEALNDADALIESLEQVLTKKRQIKLGAMQELLTGKKRLSRL